MSIKGSIKKCVELVELQFGKGRSKEWKHSDFLDLREMIFSKTGVLLSVSSLKRFFGKVTYAGRPSQNTLDTMARSINFESWDHFEIEFSGNENGHRRKQMNKLLLMGMLLVAVAAIIGWGIKLGTDHYQQHQIGQSTIQTAKIPEETPGTVVFEYTIPSFSDSFYVDFDESFSADKRRPLPSDNHTITHYYSLPDLYKINLIYHDNIIHSHNLHLKTTDWKVYLNYHEKYHPLPFTFAHGSLYVSPDSLMASGYEIDEESYLLKYRLVRDFDIDINDLVLESKVRNRNPSDGLDCFLVTLRLTGENGKISMDFAEPACSQFINVRLGNFRQDGNYADLSSLAIDFKDWQTLELYCDDEKISIIINGNASYTHKSNQDFGQLKGLFFDINQGGEIDYVTIKDLRDQVKYHSDFE